MYLYKPVEHVEHGVSTHSQEGSPHALDVLGVDPGKPDQHLGLAHNLVGPLFLIEVGAVAVGDCMGRNLVTISVEVLDLRVVGPLVGHVEGGLFGERRKINNLNQN